MNSNEKRSVITMLAMPLIALVGGFFAARQAKRSEDRSKPGEKNDRA